MEKYSSHLSKSPTDQNISDPFVLPTSEGNYYCSATSASDGFKARSSDNLVRWKKEGYVFLRREDSRVVADFWAPEAVHYSEKCYLHYSARWGTNKSLLIGVDDKAEYESFGTGYSKWPRRAP